MRRPLMKQIAILFWGCFILYFGFTLIGTDPYAQDEADKYETALGILTAGGGRVDKGAQLEFDAANKKLIIVKGFFSVPPGRAVPVSGAFKIIPEFGSPAGPINLTLVQNKANGKWLATDGKMAIYYKTSSGLIEGHSIKIIGGPENPITIDGHPFSNTTILIKDGKPVKSK